VTVEPRPRLTSETRERGLGPEHQQFHFKGSGRARSGPLFVFIATVCRLELSMAHGSSIRRRRERCRFDGRRRRRDGGVSWLAPYLQFGVGAVG